jgi:hypothetical protein
LRRLALKKLKGSDLSLFKSYFQKRANTKQKGFNLNRKVMKVFFPEIISLLQPRPQKAKVVDLVLYGPGLSQGDSLARKVKIDSKNLRLNGEVVSNPDSEPERYDVLIPGDFAVMEFRGTGLPEAVKIVLVASKNSHDAELHNVLSRYLPGDNASMEVLTEERLQAAVAEASPEESHPIWYWLDPAVSEAIEEVIFGEESEVQEREPGGLSAGREMSPDDFNASREAAARTGRTGEALLKAYFDSAASHEVESYKWVSQVNAISPYDFKLVTKNGGSRYADAKSTSGPFEAPVYLSTAELKCAVESAMAYDIYRLYEVNGMSAKLRVARNIRDRLRPVAEMLAKFPGGVKVNALSFKPDFFGFDKQVHSIAINTSDSGDQCDSGAEAT